jgi:hypothetical protein
MENETEGGNGKEGTLTPSAQDAIGNAAKANVNAAVEVAKSAVSSFVDVFTGEPKKPQRGKRRSTRKKATSKGAASKRGKAKRSAGGRRSAAASSRRATKKSSTRGGRRSDLAQGELVPPLRPAGARERVRIEKRGLKRNKAPRNPGPPKVAVAQPSAADAEKQD